MIVYGQALPRDREGKTPSTPFSTFSTFLPLYSLSFLLYLSTHPTMPTPRFTLYAAGTPNVLRAMIAIKLSGATYEVKPINLREGAQKTPEYKAICPTGKVPYLVDNGTGAHLFESGAIIQYVADVTGTLKPKDPKALGDAYKFKTYFDVNVGPLYRAWIGWHFGKPDDDTTEQEAAYKAYMEKLEALFKPIKTPYLAGDEPSVADTAAWPWLEAVWDLKSDKFPMAPYPSVDAYVVRVNANPDFQASKSEIEYKW